jgi:isopenicillin N synthase-like dioxygenase
MPRLQIHALALVGISFAQQPPVIDLRDAAVATALVDAAQNWGFAYITGHDVSEDVVEAARNGSHAFFGLPREDKEELLADKSKALKTARGYVGLRGEQLDTSSKGQPDLKEVFDIGLPRNGTDSPHLGANIWPAALPELRERVEAYAEECSALSARVIRLIAEGLGDSGAFNKAFDAPLRVQRLTRYPPASEATPTKSEEVSAGTHSDYGGVTVLDVEGPGLFVLKPNAAGQGFRQGTFSKALGLKHDSEWVHVPPQNHTMVVMFGEALHRLSNGHVPATVHRVENLESKARYSLAFFFDPSPDHVLAPVPSLLVPGEEPSYEPQVSGHKGVLLA